IRFTTGAIFSVTVPATIIKSDCRGLGRKTSEPKRAMSKRAVEDAIISIAQHARPNVIGQSADLRAQLKTKSTVVETIPLEDSMISSLSFAIVPFSIRNPQSAIRNPQFFYAPSSAPLRQA